MSLETDLLLDRRRLSRRLFAWRVVAVLAMVVAVLVGIGRAGLFGEGRHLARLNIDGIITDQPRLTRAVEKLATDRNVAALIVSIDSPGGSVAGGEGLHDAIAMVAAKKPVVAVMGGLAASAGYMVAVPAARIFARGATLTGSIGVIMETAEAGKLLNHIGITPEVIVSGPMKGQPSLVAPLSDQGRQMLQSLIMDTYDQFVQMVATGRHMDVAQVRKLADGRPYTGRQALALGLIDQIGGEQAARAWLAKARGISVTLPVDNVEIGSWAGRTFGAMLGPIWQGATKALLSQWVRLDGPLALWQPSLPGG